MRLDQIPAERRDALFARHRREQQQRGDDLPLWVHLRWLEAMTEPEPQVEQPGLNPPPDLPAPR